MPDLSFFSNRLDSNNTTQDNVIPILVLIFLPALIAEILYGSTYLSIIIILIPEIGIYGCYNLIIRKFVVRRPLGTISIILFGLIFALLEQLIIRQTSLAPLAIVTPNSAYGRINGVNIIYLIWALGYEAIFGVFIPQKLFDLIFPQKKKSELIGLFGLSMALMVFLGACYIEWFSWTQIAYPQYNNTVPYQSNVIYQLYGVIIMMFLFLYAMLNKKIRLSESKKSLQIPKVWMINTVIFVLSISWFWLLLFAFGAFPGISIIQPIIFSIFISGVAFGALYYWSKSKYWTDSTTLGVIISALVASMLAGFLTNGLQALDILAKIVFDAVGLFLLIKLYKKTSNPTIEINEEGKKGKKEAKKINKEKKVVRKITIKD